MRQSGRFVAEDFLCAVDVAAVCKGVDFLHRQCREIAKQFFDIAVVRVAPELVVVEGRRAVDVKPHCAACGLAEFRAVALEKQRICRTIDFATDFPACEFDACDDVAPLVLPAELELAVVVLHKMAEVKGLQQWITEFKEGKPRLQTHFD